MRRALDDELAKPPPGTPEKASDWVPDATAAIISRNAVKAHRKQLALACSVVTAVGMATVPPVARPASYERGIQTERSGQCVDEDEEETPGSISSAGAPIGASTPQRERRGSAEPLKDEDGVSGVTQDQMRRQRIAAAAELACSGLAPGGEAPELPLGADAEVAAQSLSRWLERTSGVMSRLVSRGLDEWDMVAELARRPELAGSESAAVLRSVGGLGAVEREEGSPAAALQHGMGSVAVADVAWTGAHDSPVAVAYSIAASPGTPSGAPSGSAAPGSGRYSTVQAVLRAASGGGGAVAVWALDAAGSPQAVLSAEAPVRAVSWHPFSKGLLLGALETGRLVVWDCRSGSTRPVAVTSLSAGAHTHPVFCLHVAGSAAANSVVSVSAEGRLCTWPAPPPLGEPSMSAELLWSAGASSAALGEGEPVAATCMAETGGEAAELALGAADGCIYTASLSGRDAGITQRLPGHAAPVTSLRRHPLSSGPMRDTLLSCGLDWTVRVWAAGASPGRAEVAKLADFGDYVLDAAWCPSPRAASVVAVADNEGCVSLWSAGQEQLGALGRVQQLRGGAVTRVVWAADGDSLLAGDSAGGLQLYSVNHEALELRGVSAKPLERAVAAAALAADDGDVVL